MLFAIAAIVFELHGMGWNVFECVFTVFDMRRCAILIQMGIIVRVAILLGAAISISGLIVCLMNEMRAAAQGHGHVYFLAVSQDVKFGWGLRFGFLNNVDQVGRVLDGLIIHLCDRVAHLQSRVGARAGGIDVSNASALGIRVSLFEEYAQPGDVAGLLTERLPQQLPPALGRIVATATGVLPSTIR